MRARYYNPDIKRFINQDIKVGDVGNSQSLNRYAYCEGNPVSLVDPFGLSPQAARDSGEESKYQWLHNLLGIGGMFWDGFDFINGLIYLAEGDPINAGISLACGIPVFGNIVAGVTKGAKAVKAISTSAKIVDACKTVGKIGNVAAGVKSLYDTYQTAQTKCKTTEGKIAYIAGTIATGFLMGKAAKWGAGKLKNLAFKALPKFKTGLQESAGKFVSKISGAFSSPSSSGSGMMNRNRGYVINPFYKGGGKTFGKYKFKQGIDIDLRGQGTYKDALNIAFEKTGMSKEQFNVTKWGKNKYGKSFPVEWKADNGAEVNIDIGHSSSGDAPTVPHVGWQTGGKRGGGGAVRGHIFVDDVPYNR